MRTLEEESAIIEEALKRFGKHPSGMFEQMEFDDLKKQVTREWEAKNESSSRS